MLCKLVCLITQSYNDSILVVRNREILGHKPIVTALVELNLFWVDARECLLHRSQTFLELS